jgi:hypothetical protein
MKYFFILFSFVCVFNCFGQQHDNNWLVGDGYSNGKTTQMTFSNNTLSLDSINRNMPMFRSSVTMSDSLGNLLFYTNGIQIKNAQYQLMQNGDSLNPGQVANNNVNTGYTIPEGTISMPHPIQVNKYYIFHQSTTFASAINGFSEKLYYTLVDMNANGGLGTVEVKNQVLLENDSMCGGQLEVVKHGNGRDWWLIQPMSGSNGYHVFLIAGNTITYHHKQYLGTIKLLGSEVAGQAVFSHQGDKYFRYDYRNDLDIYDFDRCSGLLSNYLHIPITDSVDNIMGGALTGVSISPNDRYLYVSSWLYMYQFDLWASNITASKDTVAIHDGFYVNSMPITFGYLQSAPDGKIYSHTTSRYFHVIDYPDSAGTACNVRQHDLDIFFSNGFFIPNMPHYRTPKLSGSACDTLTNLVAIKETPKAVLLYPNPSDEQLQVESSAGIEKIEVYNAIGQLLSQRTGIRSSSVSVDTRSLENGTYFMSVFVGEEVVHKAFQVLR